VRGDQAFGGEGEAATNDVVYLAPRGAEEVVRFPVRLAARGVGINAAVLQFPVLARAGLLGGGAQHAPHAGHLLPAFQGKGFVFKGRVGRIAGRHGGVVQLAEGGVEALQGLRVGVHGVWRGG